ncbi:MAG: hypothetical protein RBR39_07930 [Proteiniphilum sp.]|jgi:hypothetical protein|nr:hypothetical protein [Proteiniphilum sp.]
MPSSPYIEVSQETRARIAEIRRRASADEGRQVTNEEIVRRLIDAAERERLARVAYEAIRHQYQEVMKDLDGAMPIDHFVAQRNYAVGLQEALDLMEGKISATGAADTEREARRAMKCLICGWDDIRR